MSALPDDPISPAETAPSLPARWLTAFGRFWWDFLIGDTPELFVGTLIAIGVVALLGHHHVARPVEMAVLPVLAAAMLAATVRRARRR